ncbi:MAG TPA: hypothetical protein VGH89_25690 [Pseudonocardia sp.]
MDTRSTDRALSGLAAGRVALGSAALLAPRATLRLFGIRPRADLCYLTRIYGGRAIALGIGYLTEPSQHRGRWHRLGLFVDTSDTATALGHYLRRDVPRPAILKLGALTGSYMLVGAARLWSDLATGPNGS